jgi:hypothetical protein
MHYGIFERCRLKFGTREVHIGTRGNKKSNYFSIAEPCSYGKWRSSMVRVDCCANAQQNLNQLDFHLLFMIAAVVSAVVRAIVGSE